MADWLSVTLKASAMPRSMSMCFLHSLGVRADGRRNLGAYAEVSCAQHAGQVAVVTGQPGIDDGRNGGSHFFSPFNSAATSGGKISVA